MATTADEQKAEVRRMINSFLRFSGVPVSWNGEVNEKVAAVFGAMLAETAKCSKALRLVPLPPGGPATIAWLAEQFGLGVYRVTQNKMSVSCAKVVILKWKVEFDQATMGIASLQAARARLA